MIATITPTTIIIGINRSITILLTKFTTPSVPKPASAGSKFCCMASIDLPNARSNLFVGIGNTLKLRESSLLFTSGSMVAATFGLTLHVIVCSVNVSVSIGFNCIFLVQNPSTGINIFPIYED